MLGRSGCTSLCTSSSLFSAHGRSSNPAHCIRLKSSLSFVSLIGFSGMLGVTIWREIALLCGGAIELAENVDLESSHRCYDSDTKFARKALSWIAFVLKKTSKKCKSDSPSLFIHWNWFAFGLVRRSGSGASCLACSQVTAQWLESGPGSG